MNINSLLALQLLGLSPGLAHGRCHPGRFWDKLLRNCSGEFHDPWLGLRFGKFRFCIETLSRFLADHRVSLGVPF